jgi:Helix-turn-helix
MNHDDGSPDLATGLDLGAALGTVDEPGWDPASVAAVLRGTGTVLRQVRQARGLALAEAADRCRVSASVLSRTELARRDQRLPLLLALSGVLGVRLSGVLRLAEDEAFPLGGLSWTEDPADLLRPSGGEA